MSRPWDDEMTQRSREMKARGGATDAEYIRAFGRNRKAVMARLRYLDNPAVRAAQAERGVIYLRSSETYRAKLKGNRPLPKRAIVPPEAIEDAMRRASAPRSISAFLFGDPPPGWSALEKRA